MLIRPVRIGRSFQASRIYFQASSGKWAFVVLF